MIYAVDSYEGFPALSEHDADWFDPETMKLHYKLFDIEFVRSNLRGSGLSETEVNSVIFVKGWIPEVLGQVSGPIAVLHLDLDIYHMPIPYGSYGRKCSQEHGSSSTNTTRAVTKRSGQARRRRSTNSSHRIR